MTTNKLQLQASKRPLAQTPQLFHTEKKVRMVDLFLWRELIPANRSIDRCEKDKRLWKNFVRAVHPGEHIVIMTH